MVGPTSAIVRIKVEKSTMTMFSERFTRKRPKSPNSTQPSPSRLYFSTNSCSCYIYVCCTCRFSKITTVTFTQPLHPYNKDRNACLFADADICNYSRNVELERNRQKSSFLIFITICYHYSALIV